MRAISCACGFPFPSISGNNRKFRSLGFSGVGKCTILELQSRKHQRFGDNRAIRENKGEVLSAWDDKPYEILPGGRKSYLDEEDIVSFIDPPKELIPLDPDSYNPAAYLWKKIEDIPRERRHLLLHSLQPRHISKTWKIASARYEDSKLIKKSATKLLSLDDKSTACEFWSCRTSEGLGVLPFIRINRFKKVVFRGKDGETYGRLFLGGSILNRFASSFSPLYFKVTQLKEVMSTEQPCDLAYELGDGFVDASNLLEGFPKSAKHPWPFNDHVVIYVRFVGPGVMVGQAWQEGKVLEQVPRKFCGEILMIKDYNINNCEISIQG